MAQRARKFKKVQAKKLMKSNESISQKIFFDQIPFLAIFKNSQRSIFELGKLPKMQFGEKNFLIYLISRVFFALDFFNFLAHCENKRVRAR